MNNASIAQEYYKVVDYWKKIENDKKWKLALWVIDYQDLEIVHQFMDIEASPLGQCKDMIFRFQTIFVDFRQYERELWKEFLSWFDEVEDERYDMMNALVKDRFLKEPFVPNKELAPNIENILSELERFRTSFHEEVGELDFVLYFFPGPHHKDIGHWFAHLLEIEIPPHIRFASIDLNEERKINQFAVNQKRKVKEIYPNLNMADAMKNDMAKDAAGEKPHHPGNVYNQLVSELMEAAAQKDQKAVGKKATQLIKTAETLADPSIITTVYLLIANAYFSLKANDKSLEFSEKAIASALALEQVENDTMSYPLWRSAALLKGGLLLGMDKHKDSIEIYLSVAEKATKKKDFFFILEGYRLCGAIEELKKNWQEAFEYTLLGLYGGSQMEEQMLKSSTFPLAVLTANECAKKIPLPAKKMAILHNSFVEWLGKDWEKLAEQYTSLRPVEADLETDLKTKEIEKAYV